MGRNTKERAEAFVKEFCQSIKTEIVEDVKFNEFYVVEIRVCQRCGQEFRTNAVLEGVAHCKACEQAIKTEKDAEIKAGIAANRRLVNQSYDFDRRNS